MADTDWQARARMAMTEPSVVDATTEIVESIPTLIAEHGETDAYTGAIQAGFLMGFGHGVVDRIEHGLLDHGIIPT